jgi:hypothetical protein
LDDTIPVKKPIIARPIGGWSLRRLMVLDEAYPGVLRRSLQFSPLRRQAAFSVLAALDLNRPHHLAHRLGTLAQADNEDTTAPLRLIGRVLLDARVRDILVAVHGRVEGLIGALSRCGHDHLRICDYSSLLVMLQEPRLADHAKVLRHVPKITSGLIDALEVLEPPFVILPLVNLLCGKESAEQFIQGLDLLRRVAPDVTDTQLLQSLIALPGDTHLSVWLKRWLSQAATFPVQPPCVDGSEFVILNSAEKLTDASRRFSNCVSERIILCALGRLLYLEHRATQTIIELSVLDQGFLLEGLYGPKNVPPSASTVLTIRDKLTSIGVLMPARLAQAARFNGVARHTGAVHWEDGNLNLDCDDQILEGLANEELDDAA